jgi:hypothetical protein
MDEHLKQWLQVLEVFACEGGFRLAELAQDTVTQPVRMVHEATKVRSHPLEVLLGATKADVVADACGRGHAPAHAQKAMEDRLK